MGATVSVGRARLAAGGVLEQRTYPAHRWRVLDAQGEELACHTATREPLQEVPLGGGAEPEPCFYGQSVDCASCNLCVKALHEGTGHYNFF